MLSKKSRDFKLDIGLPQCMITGRLRSPRSYGGNTMRRIWLGVLLLSLLFNSGCVLGMAALIRWDHEEEDEVPVQPRVVEE